MATSNSAVCQRESINDDKRLATLKSLQRIRRNIIGQLDDFEELFGPSNTLMPLSYSFQSKSKYEFVDFGYKLYREHEVLIGPIDMYGLCRSADDDKDYTRLEADINEGKERLMMFISNCDNMSNSVSGSLLSVILKDLAYKLDVILGNEEVVKKISSRFPKFDASAFDKNKESILQKYINGKENDGKELVHLRVDVAPTKDENYTCYEIAQGLCQSKGHFHFMPPTQRHGYLILKMPYIRAMVTSKSTDYLFKLNAKMIMVEKIAHIPAPYCFDIRTGKVVDETEAEYMLDGCSDIDCPDDVENVIVFEHTRDISKLMVSTSEPLAISPASQGPSQDFNDVGSESAVDVFEDDDADMATDVPAVPQYKILSCAINDFVKTIQNEENRSPPFVNLIEFVNRFIRIMKRKKASLFSTNRGLVIVNVSVVRELPVAASPADQTPAAFEDLVEQNYSKFRLNCLADEIMRSCWNETCSHVNATPETSRLQSKKKRCSTPTIHNETKNRKTKR